VFKKIYNKLWNLFTLTKIELIRDNVEFNATQVVDILFWNWFLVDLTSITPDFKEDEGVARTPLETHVTRGNIVLITHFLTHTHWSRQRDGGRWRSWWDEYPIENLMAIGNFTNSPTNFVIMELGVASSQESHFVVKKMHIYRLIIKNI
jgi:hypothetical protein